MVETPLVNADLEVGADIVRILEAAEIELTLAMWVYLDDQGIWQFLLVSPQLDPDRPREPSRVKDLLEAAGLRRRRIPGIWIKRLTDKPIKELRKRVKIYPYEEGDRVGKFYIDHDWIEDAYIYRLK